MPDRRDPASGLVQHCLYGPRRRPDPEVLRSVDAVVVDVQEVGLRCYTYATSLALLLEAAAETGTRVAVCDRPNLLGPRVDGPPLDPAQRSFLGYLDVPYQHGLTLGELARVYPGLVLLEGCNLSEGRGTPLPFGLLGAPWLEGYALARELHALRLPGLRFRPLSFRPVSDTHAGAVCHGVQLHVSDAAVVRPLDAVVRILAHVRAHHPSFAWTDAASRPWAAAAAAGEPWYEPARGALVDALTGSDDVRALVEGRRAWSDVGSEWQRAARSYVEAVGPWLLHAPGPEV